MSWPCHLALSPLLLLLLGSNKWKEKENIPFSEHFYYFFIIGVWLCVLLEMIEIDMFNNAMREQQVSLEVNTLEVHGLGDNC